MKLALTLLIAGAVSATAWAGPVSYSGKSSKQVQQTAIAPGCECFTPGFNLGIYGAGIIFDGDDNPPNSLGGGASIDYFFTRNIGLEGSYTILATPAEHHEFDGALVVRFPIDSLCLAPYVMGGGGYTVNSDNSWNWFAGAGFDWRLPNVNCMGIFADGAYHWAEDSDDNFVLIRVGLKFKL
jgi:hypothetical protein